MSEADFERGMDSVGRRLDSVAPPSAQASTAEAAASAASVASAAAASESGKAAGGKGEMVAVKGKGKRRPLKLMELGSWKKKISRLQSVGPVLFKLERSTRGGARAN